jgi:ligand-binding sensor domain-containing protein
MGALLVFVPFLRTKKVVFGSVTLGIAIYLILTRQQKVTDFSIKKQQELEMQKYMTEMTTSTTHYIVEDNNGNIWLTTWSQGVYKYDGKNITNYTVKDGTKDVNLVSMYKDNQGNLWLGTPENGVFKFNGNKFENSNHNNRKRAAANIA